MFRPAGVQYHIDAAAYLPKPASVGTGPFSFFMAPPLCFKVIGFLFPFRNGRDPCLFSRFAWKQRFTAFHGVCQLFSVSAVCGTAADKCAFCSKRIIRFSLSPSHRLIRHSFSPDFVTDDRSFLSIGIEKGPSIFPAVLLGVLFRFHVYCPARQNLLFFSEI